MAPKPSASRAHHAHASHDHSLTLYRRIAVTFVVFVALLLSAVLYLSLTRATIHVVPVEEVITTEFVLDAVENPSGASEIRGKLATGSVGKTKTVNASGAAQKTVNGIARGTVTLHNTSATPQALIRTTRLQTADGVLVRLDESVTIPANGTLSAKIYADKAGKIGDLAPTSFTIPGLPANRQKEVYATSETAFVGGESMVAVVSQDEIDRAVSELSRELMEDAKQMLRSQVGNTFPGEVFSSEVGEQKVSVKAGDEASSFDVSLQMSVQGVFFDQEAVARLAEERLYQALGQGREFIDLNKEGLHTSIEKVDVKTGRANIHVYLDGRAIPSRTSRLLEPIQFAGKNEAEIREQLLSEAAIKEVSVEFWPSWIRTVPRFSDHIDVVIEETK